VLIVFKSHDVLCTNILRDETMTSGLNRPFGWPAKRIEYLRETLGTLVCVQKEGGGEERRA